MSVKEKITIPFLKSTVSVSLVKVSESLEKDGVKIGIATINWEKFSYKPYAVCFAGYSNSDILLKYQVKENYIRAQYTGIHDPVYKDSCVEFFISSGNGNYYNFEFNCIGTPYAAYGRKRDGRELLSSDRTSKIKTFSTLGDKPIAMRELSDSWELSIAIPFELFYEKEFKNPHGQSFTGNFYKCGDELPVPHYLSWNPIDIEKPDFHRPDFFGDIYF